jgi:excisionase family DNA binding protein
MIAELDLDALATAIADKLGNGRPVSLLTADQAGELLNVPPSWLMTEARAGRIPHCRLGKYVRFNRDELLAWVDGRSVGPRRAS